MKRLFPYIFLLVVAVSCIANDLPYPRLVPSIEEMVVDNAIAVDIDRASTSVLIRLEEQADEASVYIRSVRFRDSITVCTPSPVGLFNMKSPVRFSLANYDFSTVWTVRAVRKIERRFLVEGQIGDCVIDDVNRRVIVYVPESADLHHINVLDYKLGPQGCVYSEGLSSDTDLSDFVQITVSFREQEEIWRIFASPVEASVKLVDVNPWTRVAWLSAEAVAGEEHGFRYRRKGESEWHAVSPIAEYGGSFNGSIEGLEPESEYECCAYSGDMESEPRIFVTEGEAQLPNSGFEVFSNAESEYYKSWFDPSIPSLGTKWWDSGNSGSTMVGSSGVICAPDTREHAEGVCSARLDSRYVVIKFAAGNLFSGEFAGLVGTSGGKVNFGRPFTLRPRKMTLWIKYNCGVIDNVGGVPDGSDVALGDNDKCQIFVALGDWNYREWGGSPDSPVQVNTTRKETLFNPDADAVIAYGSFVSDRSVPQWSRIEIPLEYRDVTRKPTHIVVSCAASMLGDWFTGSSQSSLWVDDIQLIY